MEITKELVDYIKSLKITYNTDSNCICFNDEPADEYSIRVLCERIKNLYKIEITKEELIDILLDNDKISVVEKDKTLDEFFEIINLDNTIAENDWNIYKKWRENEAIWNVDKDGVKTSLNKCFANIVGFIEKFPKTKGRIKFNKVRNQVEFNNKQLIDANIHYILNLINKYFINDFSNVRMVKDALDNVAFKNSFNPWIEYFNGLNYVDDGIDWIEYTIKNVLCCEEQEEYYRLYYEELKMFYLATMKRIYEKEKSLPVKFDTVTTFCGENGGSGKTTYFERLFDIDGDGNSYCYTVDSDSFQPSNKDFLEKSHQCVCLFLDELSMRRAIVTSIKGYITMRTDKFRKSYGYVNEDHIRGFTITAASNNIDILKDYTTDNERRWGIIKISNDIKNYTNVNRAFDEGYRDKLWAFIKHLYETGEFKLYIDDKELNDLQIKIQRDYKASNNVDYQTIIDDLLEREYGFIETESSYLIDTDYIVEQYLHGNSYDWCMRHNEEMDDKLKRYKEGKYTLTPKDKLISKYGKINRISKKQLYDILDKLHFEYTKITLNAEIRYRGTWNGWENTNHNCRINGLVINAYWRKNESELTSMPSATQTSIPF